MKTPHSFLISLRIGGLLALAATATWAATEDKLTKSFDVKPGGRLIVEADRGSIDVKSGNADRVEIEVIRKVGSGTQAKAKEILENHEVTFSQEGDVIRVHSEFKKGWDRGWFNKGGNLQVRYQISVPKSFHANLKTAGGSIGVADLAGELRAQTAGGSLNFRKIEGPIHGRTSGGSISVNGCNGTVDVQTSGGGINLAEINGDIAARTSGGSINAKGLFGHAVVKTSGGGIDIADVKGNLEAETSGGSVKASISGQPSGTCRLSTSGGGIQVALGASVAVDVDARTSGGSVVTELPVVATVQGEQKRNHLEGKINGGGPALHLRTSGGSIRLQKL